jgi:hypothetical protein
MLESYAHRIESIMEKVYQKVPPAANLWRRFTRYHLTHPGQAEVGNVHFAPNSEHDYDWSNPRPVPSACDSWLSFPDLSAPARQVSCRDWGCSIHSHHMWWMERLPHVGGQSNGISNNWWEYITLKRPIPAVSG